MNTKRALLGMCTLALLLTGCSGNAGYDNPNDLAQAYEAAGGTCSKPSDVPAAMIGDGAQAVFCADDGVTLLIVFETEEDAKNYIDGVTTGSFTQQMVAGSRWVVVGDEVAAMSGDLGGRVVTD